MATLINILAIATGTIAAFLILYKLFVQDRILSGKSRKRQAKNRKAKTAKSRRRSSKKRKQGRK